ncbi:MAG: hypothetical protein QNK37_21735 [Acidobacteriota bacterium]|nr:hypothetical protein [Acidobacteriota bacterium]
MSLQFEIVPYFGVKPVMFGFRPPKVRKCFGFDPEVTIDMGEREEDYAGVLVRYSEKKNMVVELTFAPNTAPLLFKGEQLLGPGAVPNPLDVFLKYDNKPLETVGFVLFMKLGIAVTGYHDGDVSQRAITIFAKNHWDDLLEDATPIKL